MGKSNNKRFREFIIEDYRDEFYSEKQSRRSKRLERDKYRRTKYIDDYDDEDYY